MNRRTFLRASAGLITGAAAIGQTPPKRKPNIVFILLDDLGWGDLGCYGQKHILTPNIDLVATEGIRFTNAYAGAAVCAPSRAVLMTGLHGGHAPVRANAGTIPIADEDVTLAEVLKRAGYATGGFGKWGLGDARTPGTPTRQGFDEFFGYLHQVHAHSYYPDFLWDGESKHQLPRGAYSADLIAQRTLDFIRKHADRPFFAYACWTLPHSKFEIPDLEPYTDRPWPAGHKTYASMITRADRHVGQVVELIRELGLERDTILIVTSDNGAHEGEGKGFDFFKSNGHLRGEKGQLYEGGIRVPFIARWPGHIRPGSSSAHPIAFCDMLPTLASIAGTKPPPELDGMSILPALTGRKQPAHDYLYWEHAVYDQKAGKLRDDRLWQAVRMGDWKAIRVAPDAPVQLYDLRADPTERNDLARTNPQLVRRAEKLMKSARSEPRPHDTGSMKWVS